MHDDLIGAAARRGATWSFAGVLVAAVGPAALAGWASGPAAAPAAYVLAVVVAGGWLHLGAPGLFAMPLPRRALRPADVTLTNLAAGIGLATGTAPPAAFVLDHPQPNVAAFTGRSGRGHGHDVLVVTTGALGLLTRDELEAVCATQLAIAHDPTGRRNDGRLTAWRVARAGSAVAFLPVVALTWAVPYAILPPLVLTGPAMLAGWLVAGKLKWWSRVGADGVCVATTRHPAALVSALRRLSLWNGDPVPVGWVTKLTGAGGSRWAVAVGPQWSMTTTVNGRTTDTRTAEQVEDVNLLVRAGLVRRVCLEGADATLGCRAELVDAVRRAGRAAAQGGVVEVEGVFVGLQGVVAVRGDQGRPDAAAAGSADE